MFVDNEDNSVVFQDEGEVQDVMMEDNSIQIVQDEDEVDVRHEHDHNHDSDRDLDQDHGIGHDQDHSIGHDQDHGHYSDHDSDHDRHDAESRSPLHDSSVHPASGGVAASGSAVSARRLEKQPATVVNHAVDSDDDDDDDDDDDELPFVNISSSFSRPASLAQQHKSGAASGSAASRHRPTSSRVDSQQRQRRENHHRHHHDDAAGAATGAATTKQATTSAVRDNSSARAVHDASVAGASRAGCAGEAADHHRGGWSTESLLADFHPRTRPIKGFDILIDCRERIKNDLPRVMINHLKESSKRWANLIAVLWP
jgi:hypothetical protein